MLNFMQIALDEAKKTTIDIPVAAVIVKNNEIISIAANKKEKDNLVTSHAEILALNDANKFFKNWRLNECDMYVTLEPCPMCAWAIRSARIKNLFFGSFDTNYGAAGSSFNLFNNSNTKVFGGIMEKECDELLNNYFGKLRK